MTILIRFLTGALFIFSGFIKANDPMGFGYKLEEYFGVFGITWLNPAATFLAALICIIEMGLGLALLIGWRRMFTLWLLLAMIVFFTFLTFYSAYFNKVTDCGCFGDALKLTPWGSFTKDVIVLVLISILYAGRTHIKQLLPAKSTNVVLLIALLVGVIALTLQQGFLCGLIIGSLVYYGFSQFGETTGRASR